MVQNYGDRTSDTSMKGKPPQLPVGIVTAVVSIDGRSRGP
jgi:hypothetical protein